jgi:hypothetical protein
MVTDPPSLERPPSASEEEVREYAMHALALSCGAGGLAHQVRNPLNAMALQLALVAEKLGADSELARSCAGNLVKLREQIGRADEAVRRFLDAADPSPGSTLEAGSLVRVAAELLGHEARRCRISLQAVPGEAQLRARADGRRALRLWLGVAWRALTETPEGGVLRVSCSEEGGEVLLVVEHARRRPEGGLGWIGQAAREGARALGGVLEETQQGGVTRVALRLPGVAK